MDLGLGPLIDLASFISPKVADVAKKKIIEVMEGDVKNIINSTIDPL